MDRTLPSSWQTAYQRLMEDIGGCFSRSDLRERARSYLRGLLGPVNRKNSWQLAQYLGQGFPSGLQHLLGRASWDADRLRDRLVDYATTHLVTQRDPGVLVVDETGFLKKGRHSVGVQRQYSGTAGRVENCQIGVFLALVGSGGQTLIDRELYLPEDWCQDLARCQRVGVPRDRGFATKPQLARRMIQRAWDRGLRPAWVLADAAYGPGSRFRAFLKDAGQPYVLGVSGQQRLWQDLQQRRVSWIADRVPPQAWQRLSVAQGSKGPRVFDWWGTPYGRATPRGLVQWLLVRRSPGAPGERAYFLCSAPPGAGVEDLARASGRRWAIERGFEVAKQETGLAGYEVRSWVGWYRHITLSMLAAAFLTVIRMTEARGEEGEKNEPGPDSADGGGGPSASARSGVAAPDLTAKGVGMVAVASPTPSSGTGLSSPSQDPKAA